MIVVTTLIFLLLMSTSGRWLFYSEQTADSRALGVFITIKIKIKV
jgi:hypothetical protein